MECSVRVRVSIYIPFPLKDSDLEVYVCEAFFNKLTAQSVKNDGLFISYNIIFYLYYAIDLLKPLQIVTVPN